MHSITMLLPIISFLIFSINGQLTWHQIQDGTSQGENSSPVPSARRDMGLGYDSKRNRLILFGGRSKVNEAEVVLGDTWIFEISTTSWREVKSTFSPPSRCSFVYGLSQDYFYVSTGEGPNRDFYNDMWRFSVVTETWEELPYQKRPSYYTAQQWKVKERNQAKPSYRYGSSGGIFPNATRFYVSLGFTEERFGDTLSYSTETMGWYIDYPDQGPYRPDYPHGRRLHAGTMLSADEMLIFGGCLSGGGVGGACPASDSWMFDGRNKMWQSLPGCASARTYASLAMLPSVFGERRAVLYGGIEDGPQVLTTIKSLHNQVGIFNPDTKTWVLRQADGNIPVKRASSSMVTGRSGIFMFGGINLENDVLLNDLYLLQGTAFTADQAPKQADCKPTFFNLIMLHGVLMALGWGFFIQWGAFIARYSKNRLTIWFKLHKLFQIFGFVISIAGFIVGVVSVRSHHFQFSHGIVGLTIMILGFIQPINAFMRPQMPVNREERKSVSRVVWEFFHKNLGRISLVLAIANISLGLFMALAHQIIWAAWYTYVIILLLCYFIAESRNNCSRKRRDSGSNTESTVTEQGKRSTNKYLIHSQGSGKSDSNSLFDSGRGNSYQANDSPRRGDGSDKSYLKSVYENPALEH